METKPTATSMDLSAIRQQAQEEAWLTVLHPTTGLETTTRLRLLSPDSERYRAIDNSIKNASMQAAARRGRLSAEELADSGMRLLVECTTGWEGVVFDGQELEFTSANVRTVYTDFPFIREQADRFLADRRNFFHS